MPFKKIRTEHCKNCNFDFKIDLPHMKYCPNCGQENHSPRMPFFHYLYELMEGIFHLDNKTWLTIRTLFAYPGKITRDFIEDKRNRYSPPVRMYIWSTAFFMFSSWFFTDRVIHFNKPNSETNKSLSQRFEDMPDSSSSPIYLIAMPIWPRLPSTLKSKQTVLKSIPDNNIKSWLQDQKYPSNYFHIQLIKAYRGQLNSQLTQSEYVKKATTGYNFIFVLLLPINAFLLFPIIYRKRAFYYDSMIFTMHINTWIPLFHSVWLWVLGFMITFIHAPGSILLSIPIINAVYYLIAIKRAFNFTWLSSIARWLPAFTLDTIFHWIIILFYTAWFLN